MEQLLKNFPKTAAALENLQQNICELDSAAEHSVEEKKVLTQKLTTLQKQLAEKAASIESIIETLNGAIK